MKKKNTVKKLVLSTVLVVLVIGSADKAKSYLLQDAKWETQLVEDESKPIYEDKVIYRAFAGGFSELYPDKKEVCLEFESDTQWGAYKKAQEYFSKNIIIGKYGNLDPRIEHNLVGYEKVETQVKVADKLWE